MAKQASKQVSDLVLILFSLALAFVVWAIVRQQEILTQTILVPVEFRNLPPFVELEPGRTYSPQQIPVSFSFPKGEERMVGSAEFRITLDLGELAQRVGSTERFSEHAVRVSRDNLRAPSGLTFIEFRSEPEVRFNARLRVARAVVRPRLGAAPPAEGFRVETDQVRAEPAEIDVAVDRFHFELAQREQLDISTEEISLAGARASVRRVVGVVYDTQAGVYPMPTNPTNSVTVFVPIPEIEGERSFARVPIRYEPIRRRVGASLLPEFAAVTVTGPVSQLDRLTTSTIRLVPRPNEFLDAEAPGESFETLIDASFEGVDPDALDRLRATIRPRFVRVRFFQREPDPAPVVEAPRPTPIPIPTPTPRPTQTPLPPPVAVEDLSTSPSLQRTTPALTPVPIPPPPAQETIYQGSPTTGTNSS